MTNPTVATLLVLAFLLGAGRAHAQTPAPELTLMDAVQQAVRSHPALQLSDANIQRAQTGVSEAKAALLPTLGVDANLTRFQKPMVVAPLHGFDPRNPPLFDRTLGQGSLSAGYTLFDAARGARIDRAEELVDAATSSAAAVRMQVLADVTRAFLRVRTSREVASAHRHRTDALMREHDRAALLVSEGRAARVVLLRADAALSVARADAVTATGDVEVAEHDLARQMNVSADSIHGIAIAGARLRPGAEMPSADAARALAHDSSPELERARRQIAAAEATRSEARGLRLPRVQIGGRYIEYTSSAGHPEGEWQGGAQLSYPVLTGGTRQAANDRAGAEVQAAQAELSLAERRIDDAIDRAFSALASAHARATALEAAVTQSEEVARIELLSLSEGAGVQTDYLNAEADLFRARAALTEARALEVIARIDLARASGQLTESWIASNVESFQ